MTDWIDIWTEKVNELLIEVDSIGGSTKNDRLKDIERGYEMLSRFKEDMTLWDWKTKEFSEKSYNKTKN